MTSLSKKNLLLLVFTLLFGSFFLFNTYALAETANSATPALQKEPFVPVELTYGDPNAPVIIVEYSSYTCGHCAEFHKNIFPKIKTTYIDKGHVFYLVREFPMDLVALQLGQITLDQNPDLAKNLRSALMNSQEKWLLSSKPLEKAQAMMRLAGITDSKVKTALANKDLKKQLLNQRLHANSLGVDATPTFIIFNKKESEYKGSRISGSYPYQEYEKKLNKRLENNGKAI